MAKTMITFIESVKVIMCTSLIQHMELAAVLLLSVDRQIQITGQYQIFDFYHLWPSLLRREYGRGIAPPFGSHKVPFGTASASVDRCYHNIQF